jgi:hypothetical protein
MSAPHPVASFYVRLPVAVTARSIQKVSPTLCVGMRAAASQKHTGLDLEIIYNIWKSYKVHENITNIHDLDTINKTYTQEICSQAIAEHIFLSHGNMHLLPAHHHDITPPFFLHLLHSCQSESFDIHLLPSSLGGVLRGRP